ncbi:MAG: hypothetical protein ACJAYB_002327 [Psychromonas sp.]|jgi:hypothetical protein
MSGFSKTAHSRNHDPAILLRATAGLRVQKHRQSQEVTCPNEEIIASIYKALFVPFAITSPYSINSLFPAQLFTLRAFTDCKQRLI